MDNFTVDTSSCLENSSSEHHTCHIQRNHAIILALLTAIFAIVGTLGNILVLGAVYTTKTLQTISSYLLVSMATADLIVTALAQPLFAVFLAAGSNGSCTETIEFLFRLFSNASCAASVLHLSFISLERAVVIMRPFSYHNFVTKTKLKFSLVFIWLIPVVYSVMRVVVNEKRVTSMFTVAVMAVSFMTIFVSYAIIFVNVHHHGQNTREILRRSRQKSNEKQQENYSIERSMAMTIAMVIVVFTLMWIPMIVLRVMNADNSFSVVYNWARALALLNSACNPWIYCLRIPRFREAFKRIAVLHCQASRNLPDVRAQSFGSQKELSSSNPSCSTCTTVAIVSGSTEKNN